MATQWMNRSEKLTTTQAATATSYHVEMQHASNLAQKLNKELDYINYAHTVAQQSHLPTYFSETAQLLGKELERGDPKVPNTAGKAGFKVASSAHSGPQAQMLSKIDVLEAFKGHADLVRFLQERVCSKR